MLLELLCKLHAEIIQRPVVCDGLHYSLGSLDILLCHGTLLNDGYRVAEKETTASSSDGSSCALKPGLISRKSHLHKFCSKGCSLLHAVSPLVFSSVVKWCLLCLYLHTCIDACRGHG